MTERILEAKDIRQYFGGVRAVDGVSLHVNTGEVLGIIGPNGSGKTTFFNAATGVYKPTSGQFLFDGDDITGLPMHVIAKRGVIRTFQIVRNFRSLCLTDIVMVGQHSKLGSGALSALVRLPGQRAEERAARAKAHELLEMVGLEDMSCRLAGALGYGQQKRLELARALASEPKLLLLDEPTAGVPEEEGQELMNLVLRLREVRNLTVIIIEHNMRVMRHVADRMVAMDRGHKISEGTPEEVLHDPCVVQAYLGDEEC